MSGGPLQQVSNMKKTLFLLFTLISVFLIDPDCARAEEPDPGTFTETSNMEEMREMFNRDIFNGANEVKYKVNLQSEYNDMSVRELRDKFEELDLPSTDVAANTNLMYDCKMGDTTYYLTADHVFMAEETVSEDKATYIKQANAKINEIAESIPDKVSEEAQVREIYKWITSNVKYDESKTHGTSADAALNGEATCNGYALLFQQLCSLKDIQCAYILGETSVKKDSNHAWNAVRIDNQWYLVDSCWDAPNKDWQYYLKSNKDFKNHINTQTDVTIADKSYVTEAEINLPLSVPREVILCVTMSFMLMIILFAMLLYTVLRRRNH